MGCSSSKVDDLPAVALCRERLTFLDEAIHQRYALAEAHLAYILSLKGIGHSLRRFIQQDLTHSSTSVTSPHSPELNLPPHKKGDSLPLHHEDSGHLDFNSGSDSEDNDLGSLHHHLGDSTPFGNMEYMDTDQTGRGGQLGSYRFQGLFPGGGSSGGVFMHMNYMQNKPTPPSVVYEQRPADSGTVQMGESSSVYSGYPPFPNYGNSNPSSSAYAYYGSASPPNSNYNNYGGGYYANSLNEADTSSKKPPPPPPSPPKSSAWDFFNPFESYDKYYAAYSPSNDSKELREEEGIPDLEDEDYQHEVVKEVHGDQKFVADAGRSGGGGGSGKHSKAVVDDTDASTLPYETRPSAAMENDAREYDVHVMEDKAAGDEERSEETRARFKGPLSVVQVAKEIEIQFERASESGNEIAKMLEVGKLPHNRKHSVYQVSSKMLHAVTPSMSMVSSQPPTSKGADSSAGTDEGGPAQSDMDEYVVGLRSRNISSTLRKLYLWEKKLYNEVKAEEKMRVIYDRKVDKLKRLDERGAEAHKVDTTRTLIRDLSTKIRMAIQVVDKISVTISKIRDEELWPQLNELIQGLTRMWKSMLECHRSQCQAIREAKGLGPIGSGKKLGDGHISATSEFVHELIRWTVTFSSWISAQKGYVRALNNWLLKCLLYEPEETVDGVAPFSPSRIGAPPVFVICNQWSQALERLSEKEVMDSLRVFSMSVIQIWEQDKLEMPQRMMANKDPERKVKNLDRGDQKIQKEIQTFDKKMIMVFGDGNRLSVGEIVYQSDTHNSSLQASLQKIFEAMERFTANSLRAYEELLQRCEEQKDRQDHERVPQG
ncbi:protein ALTERED PHOSPHATE STARVATION RESPONSE 1-like [Carya illinoinensis]|uniref:BZIP transcription factor n=1 Tax=Carya illinoinensis TaxID=32201 RepID=A0A8T1QAU3_CARIL|nr:protein ALTERED PHOSPHATE STARVATION RESPONSE 1-like [Carya illinoinensis]KAG6651517.1 hypothetical protein CIPAW_06G117500 [Carya illinoinensis]KAG6709146.1 hypothetical protein I3842_06G117400 [Carya illinoinensis]